VAHWLLHPRWAKPRRPLLVLDIRGGITQAYGSSRYVVSAGQTHLVLAALARALGVNKGCESSAAGLVEGWAKSLAGSRNAVVVVGSEFGRAARWYEIGRLAGEIAGAVGGSLLPLTVYGNALGALRLAEKLGLAECGEFSAPPQGEEAEGLTLALGTGLAELVCGSGDCVAATALRPAVPARCRVVLPVAWPFEVGGPVMLPGTGVVTSQAAIAPPAGVPTVGELVEALVGGRPAAPLAQFGDLPRVERGRSRALNLSVLEPRGAAEGLLTVLAGDSVNFADGSISRRVSFAQNVQPLPTLALSRVEASRLGLSDGEVVGLSTGGPQAAVSAMVAIEEDQAEGRATLSGAYAEARRLVAEACGEGPVQPAKLAVVKRKV